MAKRKREKTIATLKHDEASRKNIPTAEFRSVMDRCRAEPGPCRLRAPQPRPRPPARLARQGPAGLVGPRRAGAAPLHPGEGAPQGAHRRPAAPDAGCEPRDREDAAAETQPDLFADFNGLPDEGAKTEFYQHDANWSNRMILGDSLQVMASLAGREGMRGKVQCIYLDPPYGIKFNSNFQWSTTSRDVKDGKAEHISREPEQVKAFRDTWRDGVHSYLTYLRDRLTVARDLLAESGSIFVQIGNENVHRVRALVEEVFGSGNYVGTIGFQKTGSTDQALIPQTIDSLLVFARNIERLKYRRVYLQRERGSLALERYDLVLRRDGTTRRITREEVTAGTTGEELGVRCRLTSLTSARPRGEGDLPEFSFGGAVYTPGAGTFKSNLQGLNRLGAAGRLFPGGRAINYLRRVDDFPVVPINDRWESVQIGTGLTYVVQTSNRVIQRCILMTTDPGDLVLDPTCGSGTTAYVAEQWGRRWITIDTSRVALALARGRVMAARYSYYVLADSPAGRRKVAEITGKAASEALTHGDVRQGFVYERVPHITLKSIANNTEIDVIWERWQETLEPLRENLNAQLDCSWEEWQIPREASDGWPAAAVETHRRWWEARVARQQEVDASIAAKADHEYLYDKPYEDNRTVRVAGPFTVESLFPHRVLAVDEDDELVDRVAEATADYGPRQDFAAMILEQLATAGVQQAHKEDRIAFATVTPWPGEYICAEGRYAEVGGDSAPEKRAGIFVGPEFGTVSRPDLVAAAREAGDAGFDVLIACAFNYEAHASEFDRLGRIPVLKARMNADLHMAGELKNTGKGNLFVIFGEPDIDILPAAGEGAEGGQLQVKINGVDVFHPNTGEVRSDGADGIACWFIDTDYNEESFFVRHAYFLGANDPYKALKTTLKAEIDPDAWATLNNDISRPFDRPASGRIAVKVINHLGDEVMKVFRV